MAFRNRPLLKLLSFVLAVNGTAYNKVELAPDTAFLAIYILYENDNLTYVKLAITENEDVIFID